MSATRCSRLLLLAFGCLLLASAVPMALGQHDGHDHGAASPEQASFFTNLLKAYTPRRVCMFYEAPVIWLHFVSDLLTALAYYGIALGLGYFIWRRKDLAFSWMFWLFAAFILACGTTHLFGVLDLWHPLYKVDGLIKLATALLSLGTAIAMWPLIPQALAIPSPAQLAATVDQRTAQLADSNQALREALESAQQARQLAEEANRAKDHFLAVLSHELRTPLTPVLASVSMLQEQQELHPETLDELEMIRRNVEMEARLIDDLLDVTRIAQGKVELDRQTIELCTIIQRTAEVCMPDIQAKQLHFGIDWGDRPYRVDADIARLQQVFWNLLKNAVKFTPSDGCVGVRCRRQGDHVLVEVHDSGIGIESEVMSRLFKPFEQGERGITRQFGGLGLGLTISKALLEMHGGKISVHSPGRGQGAIFSVLLPLVPQTQPLHRPGPASIQPARQSRPVEILLVEDHDDTSRIMAKLLRSRGHRVQVAHDVASAERLAISGPFDLIISDLGLPDGTGWELMSRLQAAGRRLPAIAISGYGMSADVQKSREAGFVEHLTKPLDFASLLAAVSRIADAKADRHDDA